MSPYTGRGHSDFVPALLQKSSDDRPAYCWLIADRWAVDRYGIGMARPWPVPRGQHVRSGYLIEAPTLDALAEKVGVDAVQLSKTVARFNEFAVQGVDPYFDRGVSPVESYQGDEDNPYPNPVLAPLTKAPFYAVKALPAEIGTFAGIATDRFARAITSDGSPVPGLYAVGNDQMSVFGGAYPGAGSTLGPGLTFGYIAGRHLSGKL